MADPLIQHTTPDGHPFHPGALDEVPADFKDMSDDGTPYVPTIVPQDDDDTLPKLIYQPLTAPGGGGALDDLTDVVITSPTLGDVLKYNGTDWVNGTSSGGGSAFGAAGPKTDVGAQSWSWENQGSASVTVSSRDGSVHLQSPADATNTYRARMQTAPSTPWTAIANLEMPFLLFDYVGFGIGVGNGSNLRALYIAAVSGVVNLYVAPTTGRAWGAAYVGPFALPMRPKFLAIRDDGTNNTFYIGEEEENLLPVFGHGRTSDGITASQVGFFISPRNGTIAAKLSVFSWKFQSAAPG